MSVELKKLLVDISFAYFVINWWNILMNSAALERSILLFFSFNSTGNSSLFTHAISPTKR